MDLVAALGAEVGQHDDEVGLVGRPAHELRDCVEVTQRIRITCAGRCIELTGAAPTAAP